MSKLLQVFVVSSLMVVGGLPVLAQSPTPVPSPTALPTVTPAAKQSVDFACLQNVVERRDSSIIATVDGHHATIKSALEMRRDALKAAFGLTDKKQRQNAIRTAWNTYKGVQSKARNTFRDAKNAAWRKFSEDRKACGSGAAAEDKTPSGVDATL